MIIPLTPEEYLKPVTLPEDTIFEVYESTVNKNLRKEAKRFAFYSLVSSALERRVWIPRREFKPCIPNLYVFFVGEAGTNKSNCISVNHKIIRRCRRWEKGITQSQPAANLSPLDATPEALVDMLSQEISYKNKTPIRRKFPSLMEKDVLDEYTPCYVLLDEMSTLIKNDDKQFGSMVTFLQKGFDNEDYDKLLKGSKGQLEFIPNLSISLLSGSTCQWMKNAFDGDGKASMKEGMISRCFWVFFPSMNEKKFWNPAWPRADTNIAEDQKLNFKATVEIVQWLNRLFHTMGPMRIAPDAYDVADEWYESYVMDDNNIDERFKNFKNRIAHNVVKLAMCIHFSYSTEMILWKKDIEKAIELTQAVMSDMHKCITTDDRPLEVLAAQTMKRCLLTRGEMTGEQLFNHLIDLNRVKSVKQFELFTQSAERLGYIETSKNGSMSLNETLYKVKK